MIELPTVLLRHTTRQGTHYDWLLADPRDPSGMLVTFRVRAAPSTWADARCFALEPAALHRRIYLKHEGAITGGRGQVQRVDEGTFVARLWTPRRAVLDLRLRGFVGAVEMRRHSAALWRATCAGSTTPEGWCIDDDPALPLGQRP